jgi:hypothetical protein
VTNYIRSSVRRRCGPPNLMSRNPKEHTRGEKISIVISEHVNQQALDPDVSARD